VLARLDKTKRLSIYLHFVKQLGIIEQIRNGLIMKK